MTMTSDEERREVARKIREYVDAYGDGIEDAETVLLGTVWGRDNRGDVIRPTSEAELLSMLADLIDLPTCSMEYGGHVPDLAEDALGVYFCSECGSPIYNDMEPTYCPYCGAMVTEKEDE